MNHFAFVASAYAVSAIVIAAMIGWIIFDMSARKRELADLEARGVRRRSDRAEPAS